MRDKIEIDWSSPESWKQKWASPDFDTIGDQIVEMAIELKRIKNLLQSSDQATYKAKTIQDDFLYVRKMIEGILTSICKKGLPAKFINAIINCHNQKIKFIKPNITELAELVVDIDDNTKKVIETPGLQNKVKEAQKVEELQYKAGEDVKNDQAKISDLTEKKKQLGDEIDNRRDILKKHRSAVAGKDAEKRAANRKEKRDEKNIRNTLIRLIKGKITDYNDEVKQYVNCADPNEISSLTVFAVRQHKMKLFEWIFDGIKPGFTDGNNHSLLYLCAKKVERLHMLEKLLGHGENAREDSAALFQAVLHGNVEACRLLIKHQASGDCYDSDRKLDRKQSGVMCAIANENLSILELLTTALHENGRLDYNLSNTAS